MSHDAPTIRTCRLLTSSSVVCHITYYFHLYCKSVLFYSLNRFSPPLMYVLIQLGIINNKIIRKKKTLSIRKTYTSLHLSS